MGVECITIVVNRSRQGCDDDEEEEEEEEEEKKEEEEEEKDSKNRFIQTPLSLKNKANHLSFLLFLLLLLPIRINNNLDKNHTTS